MKGLKKKNIYIKFLKGYRARISYYGMIFFFIAMRKTLADLQSMTIPEFIYKLFLG